MFRCEVCVGVSERVQVCGCWQTRVSASGRILVHVWLPERERQKMANVRSTPHRHQAHSVHLCMCEGVAQRHVLTQHVAIIGVGGGGGSSAREWQVRQSSLSVERDEDECSRSTRVASRADVAQCRETLMALPLDGLTLAEFVL